MMKNTNLRPWCSVRNKKYLPTKLKVHHIKGYQDKNSRTKDLSLSARLNISADKLIGENAKAPLMINIKNTPIAVYINKNTFLTIMYQLSEIIAGKKKPETS